MFWLLWMTGWQENDGMVQGWPFLWWNDTRMTGWRGGKKSRATALLRNFSSFLVILSCRSHSSDDWGWRDGQGWRNSNGLKPSPSHSVILESSQDGSRMTGWTGMEAIRICSDFLSFEKRIQCWLYIESAPDSFFQSQMPIEWYWNDGNDNRMTKFCLSKKESSAGSK